MNYLQIIQEVFHKGDFTEDRTGTGTQQIPAAMFQHDLREGFPLETTKFVSLKNVAVELEGFISEKTDKRWYQERGCHIWDEWESPFGHRWDLGPIYGAQWRGWADFSDPEPNFIDQLKEAVDTLKNNPTSRRMLVSAWNPSDLPDMALPPCHFAWQLLSDGKYLDLIWYQRSVDVGLGLPYNIASYGLLCHVIATQTDLIPRHLVGHLSAVHIYSNHREQLKEQLTRKPYPFPKIGITCSNVYDWTHKDFKLEGYQRHPSIKMEVSV